MLETLRQHSRSWGTKLIFGAIALIFALYFGFSFNQGPPGGPAAPVAKVNGETIPLGVFTQSVQNQTAMLERFNPGKIPQETYQVLESQILQNLIGKNLLAQEAHRLGLRVPDRELADEIRGNPAFQKDGIFNEGFYLDQFKPYFERQNGEDYEDALRQDLLVEKFRNVLEKAAVLSTRQAETQKKLERTQLNVKQWSLAIEKGDAKSRERAWKSAQEWIATDKIPEGADAPKPAVSETGLKAVSELIPQLGREDSLPPLQCLLELPAGKKCDSPFQIGDQVVALQLLEKKTLEASPEDAASPSAALVQARKYQVLTAVQNLLTREAKIETFLKKK